ncbi:endonuclease [Acetobacteroides hydrogenigenes]|uniref:Uncharacterized protein DUF4493 n=1 Tax=Acetobacteroides hydrogenigenes TaxID=979970 RepID=A0A4R2EM78_9BACT|nr:endonuclease [Acetobacteroides hydrogenigenes]TCN67564.1 uncharacterized protein DUF4493 [Acetobacteroides hydrogenigenes]
MRVRLALLGILSLAFFISGCYLDKENDENAPQVGIIKVNILPDATNVIPDSLSVEIKKSSGEIVKSYSKTSEIPSSGVSLPIGDYDISVIPTNKKKPLFDRPLYQGSSTTTVSYNSTNSVNINLKQSNFCVGINYSDKFKAEATNYSTIITDAQGALAYTSTETRLGFFAAGPITITTTYTDSKGVKQTIVRSIAASDPSIAPASKLIAIIKLPNEDVAGDLTGYYQNASGKTGIELKKALSTIITTGYIAKTYNDLWEAYKIGDIRKDGTGAIWDIYSDIPSGKAPYLYQPGQDQCGSYSGEGSCYNREHTIPKSWFNDEMPMYSDYLHILPTDGYVNGRRSNYPYGEVGTATWTSKNGSKLGSAKSTLGYSGTVFEPIEAYKGDIARIYFYFVTRYADKLKAYDNTGKTEEVFNANDYGLDKWVVTMMLRWSKNDPVSQKEIERNNKAEAFQKNRNPYVDHPEFLEMIWGSTSTLAPSKAAGVKYIYITAK